MHIYISVGILCLVIRVSSYQTFRTNSNNVGYSTISTSMKWTKRSSLLNAESDTNSNSVNDDAKSDQAVRLMEAIVTAMVEGRDDDLQNAGLKVTRKSSRKTLNDKLQDPEISRNVLGTTTPDEQEVMDLLQEEISNSLLLQQDNIQHGDASLSYISELDLDMFADIQKDVGLTIETFNKKSSGIATVLSIHSNEAMTDRSKGFDQSTTFTNEFDDLISVLDDMMTNPSTTADLDKAAVLTTKLIASDSPEGSLIGSNQELPFSDTSSSFGEVNASDPPEVSIGSYLEVEELEEEEEENENEKSNSEFTNLSENEKETFFSDTWMQNINSAVGPPEFTSGSFLEVEELDDEDDDDDETTEERREMLVGGYSEDLFDFGGTGSSKSRKNGIDMRLYASNIREDNNQISRQNLPHNNKLISNKLSSRAFRGRLVSGRRSGITSAASKLGVSEDLPISPRPFAMEMDGLNNNKNNTESGSTVNPLLSGLVDPLAAWSEENTASTSDGTSQPLSVVNQEKFAMLLKATMDDQTTKLNDQSQGNDNVVLKDSIVQYLYDLSSM